MNNQEYVKDQYSDDSKLAVRYNLHDKYSTNKQGFTPWMYGQYKFFDGARILELGCGNAVGWEGRVGEIGNNSKLILSDFSMGMVEIIYKKYKTEPNILTMRIDIQEIPFPDDMFDIIIAKHMLYHVPDLSKALGEVARVLKNGGVFYASTNGNGGHGAYVRNAIKTISPELEYFSNELSFSLENGTELLNKYFSEIKLNYYIDSLCVTETIALIDWIKSTIFAQDFPSETFDKLYNYFESIRIKKGAVNIPKEAGLFIAVK